MVKEEDEIEEAENENEEKNGWGVFETSNKKK